MTLSGAEPCSNFSQGYISQGYKGWSISSAIVAGRSRAVKECRRVD